MSETEKSNMAPYRSQIDSLDKEIVALIGKRYDIVRKVAALKHEKGIPTYIVSRVREVKDNCEKLAIEHNIDPMVMRMIYTIIIDYACDMEEDLIEKAGKKD